MGNDMSWEQKCRISALRAACASQFDLHGVAEVGHPESFRAESDEQFITRILKRAETFRVALLGHGALDYTPGDEELPESNVCPGCGSLHRDKPNVTVSMPSAPDLYCNHKWHQE